MVLFRLLNSKTRTEFWQPAGSLPQFPSYWRARASAAGGPRLREAAALGRWRFCGAVVCPGLLRTEPGWGWLLAGPAAEELPPDCSGEVR